MYPKGLLKQHSNALNVSLRFLDAAMIGAAAFLAHGLYLNEWTLRPGYPLVVGMGILLAAWAFSKARLYEPWRGASVLEEVRMISLGWGGTLLALFTIAYLTKLGPTFSRGWLTLWAGFSWIGLLALRLSLRKVLRILRKKGLNQRYIVLAGQADIGEEVARRVARAPWAGFAVAGFFADGEKTIGGVKTLGALSDLPAYIAEHDVDQVWLTMPLRDEDKVRTILHDLRHTPVNIRFVPDLFGLRLLNHSVTEVAGLAVLNLSTSPMEGTNWVVKEVEDKLLSLLILLLISPLMLAIAIGVKLSSPGPVFYRQERVGWNGRSFDMLKFRSMPVDAEGSTGPVWAKPGEKRATPFGAFLRRTSLDELPQFINVLRGEMSIVGPRPERPVFVDKFKDEIPDYMKKHLVKAGITGWAQINGWRGDTDLAKRIEYDLYYIENWSLWFDLKIIFLTLFKGLVSKNAY
jgi:putative colanic acid biosynthesis UDP-glucose lipid carrier transferase